jgi:hypothetical protein
MTYYIECYKCHRKYEATVEDYIDNTGEKLCNAPIPKELKMVEQKPNNYVFECC